MGLINLGRWQIASILLVTLWALLYSLPNILPATARSWAAANLPSWLPQQPISLGLDLRGGSHLLLEVQTEVVLKDYLEASVDQVRTLLRAEKVNYTELTSSHDQVSVRITDTAQLQAARRALAEMTTDFMLTEEGNRLIFSMREQAMRERKLKALEQSIEIVRRRVDESGTREPIIQRQSENRIVVQLPGIDNPGDIKRLLGQTAKLSFHLVDADVNPADLLAGRVPPGHDAMPDATSDGRIYAVQRRVMVSGDNLVDARMAYQQGQPVVNFRFDNVGARRFGDTTKNNVGRLFAIVLDNKVISAPVINEPIIGGSGVISGSFTAASANELAILLRAGALPAPISVIEERTVGPGLGADSIRSGGLAALIGTVLVVGMMVGRYRLFGVFASIALVLNVIMIFAVMTVLQATLTLPGIAGIILIIGTAVDANVLIFERIKEEVRNGRSLIAALDSGYSSALSAVIDANVTNLIAAFLLFALGSGPIKGFGVTLTIGTLTSMFTAIMITRLLVVWWLRSTRPKVIPL